MGNFDASGTELVSEGQKYVQISATTLTVKTGPGRVARIIPLVGTGTVQIWDNTAASGQVIWPAVAVAIGVPQQVSCPVQTGITVTVAAATTILLVYT